MATLMLSKESTEALVRKSQQGDSAAYDELMGRFAGRLRAMIVPRLGPGLRAGLDPEDVLQETSLRALGSIGKVEWRGEEAFAGWLGGIAMNILREALGSKERRPAGPLHVDVPADDPSPSRAMRREERMARLEDVLNALSPDHRQVILMARIQRIPVKEIASRMGRSPAAVSQLLLRALDKLKEAFGETESFHLPPRSLEGKDAEG